MPDVKIALDISKEGKLIIAYKDTGIIPIQLLDGSEEVISLAGSVFKLEVFTNDATIVTTLTAELDADETTATITIDSDFWDAITLKTKYSFRITRSIADEVKTFVRGEVTINL